MIGEIYIHHIYIQKVLYIHIIHIYFIKVNLYSSGVCVMYVWCSLIFIYHLLYHLTLVISSIIFIYHFPHNCNRGEIREKIIGVSGKTKGRIIGRITGEKAGQRLYINSEQLTFIHHLNYHSFQYSIISFNHLSLHLLLSLLFKF